MRQSTKIAAGLILLFASTTISTAVTAQSDNDQVKKELEALQQERERLAKQSQEFDRRIRALEEQLNVDGSSDSGAATSPASTTSSAPTKKTEPSTGTWGTYEPGKGFVLARTDVGEVSFSAYTYARYLNQEQFDDTYTDSFGRTSTLDLRNDVQFQKVTLNFKGWLFDPKFRYLFYTWTSNTSQGDPAQVVVAGNLGYQFNEHFNLYTGIGALPTTRSTNYTFPNWLKNDHRTIADEYFRGSYTSGIWANGAIIPGLKYRAMLGNNLSQLGVNASQLDDGFNTFSGAVWWMPTTDEYGPGEGLGDYEFHEEFSTLFGIHYSGSRETAQAQPGTEGFENSQIRLSDGTRVFSNDPFTTGGNVTDVRYKMAAVNGGFKYRGWSLEAEFYYRWLDDFQTTGPIPVEQVKDNGFQVQGSMMVIPKVLQAYTGFSKIYGDYGDPSDFTIGVNWYPFKRKETHIQVQGLYLKDSPVGYSSVPFQVGGNGWAFTTDLIVSF